MSEPRVAKSGDGADEPLARAVARAMAPRVAGYAFDEADDPRRGERELGAFAFRWVLALLQQMGVMREPGEAYELDRLKRRLGVASKYDRFFAALIRRLEERDLVTVDERGIVTTERVRDGALVRVEEEVADFRESFEKRHPTCTSLLRFMACCMGRFEEIITGQVDVAEVLFEDGNMDVFADVFRGDAVSNYFNRVVADAVRSAVERLREGESKGQGREGTAKIRVLEVGAGTGGTTAAILEAIKPWADCAEFCFTDISLSFIRHARRLFSERYPWIDYRILHIEKDLAQQGFEVASFDIVVASNVLHDTRDIEFTLTQTRRLLKPGGVLILDEFNSVKDCLFFSGALLHGYWLFEDPERRQLDSCLLSVPQWTHALERTGFGVAATFVLPTQNPGPDCSQSVMLCEALEADGRALETRATLARKTQRRAFREPTASASGQAAEVWAKPEERTVEGGNIGESIEQDILTLLGAERSDAYAAQRPLMDMGLDSIELVELKSLLKGRFGVTLPSAFLFEHNTQEKIAKAVATAVAGEQTGEQPARQRAGEASRSRDRSLQCEEAGGRRRGLETAKGLSVGREEEGAIAIVGVACRFPGGASSPEAFWKLLERGDHGIVPMPPERWRWPASIEVDGEHKGIDRGGFLERVDEFDAQFFRISPKEAKLMDPQQRLLLELSWEAMEDGGCRPSHLAGRNVGVFVGVCQSDYRDVLVASSESTAAYVGSGTAFAMLANRLSYFYDFKGPSLTVDTACSSSLFALHHAMTALKRGECEQALVGAVNLLCSPTISVAYYQAGMLSSSGTCRVFDAAADGYVRGEGGAMLLLKPLELALAQGDSIYGLVRGTAVNHGGQATTLTAPKPSAQAEVIEAAWREAGLAPDSVGYIEAHGTGTRLGDPVEVSGLTEAFRRLYQVEGRNWPAEPHCGLGSVKSNIGHLEGAAGLAGLIKILMSFQHGRIPRTVNFQRLNPEIDLAGTPFFIVEQTQGWPTFRDQMGRELPRCAGVSSFGFGGANAHAVIEEYRHTDARPSAQEGPDEGQSLVPLSAASQEALAERARQLLELVEQLDGRASPRAQVAAPGGSLERVSDELRSLLRRRFGLGEACTPSLEWAELGWGPVDTQLFLAALEEAYGVRLHPRSLIEFPSLQAIAERIVQARGELLPERGVDAPGQTTAGGSREWVTVEEVAYTLQVGREPMQERVVFLVESWAALASALRSYLAGDVEIPGCYSGISRRVERGVETLPQGGQEAALETGIARRDLPTLATLWSRGVDVDWDRLYPSVKPRRAHLPTYPFARDRYWVSGPPARQRPGLAIPPTAHRRAHSVVRGRDRVPGTQIRFEEHRLSALLTGDEFFIADHVIRGRRMLPAVAYLEMARAAAERATGASRFAGGEGSRCRIRLERFAWVRPLYVDQGPVQLSLQLIPEGDESLEVEFYSASDGAEGEAVFHGQGKVVIATAAAVPVLDLEELRARCTKPSYSTEECYHAFSAIGYEYGPAHRAIDHLSVGEEEILAKLTLPSFLSDTRDAFVLHPAMVDAAVQATIGFSLADRREAGEAVQAMVPFEVESAEVYERCAPTMWASIRRSESSDGEGGATFSIDLCDEAGRLCARFTGWSTRRLRGELPDGRLPSLRGAARAASIPPDEFLAGELNLTPTWELLQVDIPQASRRSLARGVAIVGGTDRQRAAVQEECPEAGALPLEPGYGIEQMRETIAAWGAIEHIVWIVPPHRPVSSGDDSLISAQREGSLFCFRLIKAMLGEGYGDRSLTWSVITTATQAVEAPELTSPTHASVHGLIGSVAKEYPNWNLRLIDMPSSQDWPWEDLLAIPGDPDGNALVYRDQGWFRHQLVPFQPPGQTVTAYRQGGVYIVIGGAGGIGQAWSEALLRRISAQLVWIGRRPKDEMIQARLDRLAELGPAPVYIAADAGDRLQLEGARDRVKGRFGRIDGVIHAAMVLKDKSLANMTEEDFMAGLSPKVDVCVRLAQVFAAEPPDFVLFFSSINSFVKWPGQSNYSAGCTFKDAFAQRLAAEWPSRVRVINWGYWSVGSLASERYRSLMARKGLGSIEAQGAMAALDRLLAAPVRQAAYLNAIGPNALAGANVRAADRGGQEPPGDHRGAAAPGIAEIMGAPRDTAIGHLLDHLQLRAAETLNVDPQTLDSRSRPFAEALLGEFGVDSLSSNSLRNTLRQELGVEVPAQRIISEKARSIVESIYEQLLLMHVSKELGPEDEAETETETFVF